MEKLDRYIGRSVAISLCNGYFYKGKVVSADENSITILDVTGKNATLHLDSILTIREVSNG